MNSHVHKDQINFYTNVKSNIVILLMNRYMIYKFYNINDNHTNIMNYVSLISIFCSFKNTTLLYLHILYQANNLTIFFVFF